ncbi:MAG: ATP-binding protein [Bacteroidota bacterium]
MATFLLLLWLPFVKAQDNARIDSLKSLISESDQDSLKMEWYNDLRILTIRKDVSEAMGYADQYLALAQQLGLPFKEALGHAYRGNIHVRLAEYEQAIEELLLAIRYFESVNDSVRMGSIYNSIGVSYEKMGNDSLPLTYFNKSYSIFSHLKDSKRTAIALNSISHIHTWRGELDKSDALLSKAVQLLDKKPEFQDYFVLISLNLANTKIDLNKFAEANRIFQSMMHHPAAQDNYHQAVINQGLGKSKLRSHQYEEALSYLKTALPLVEAHHFFSLKADLLQYLSEAYIGLGKADSALSYFGQFYFYQDSISNAEKSKHLSNAIQQYEAEKKDQEIQTQQLELKNLWLLLLAVASVLGIGILGFYLRSRQQTYKADILEEKSKRLEMEVASLHREKQFVSLQSILEGQEEERLRIARDLHDNIGSMMAAIKIKILTIQENLSVVENISEQLDSMVGHVSDEIRRISHNMTPLAFGLSGLEGAVVDLCQDLRAARISVSHDLQGLEQITSKEKTIMLYRIFQELVQNIVKHAQATEVHLSTRVMEDMLEIEIRDDGVGMQDNAWEEGNSMGLRNVKSRINYLEGVVTLTTTNGSHFHILIPLTA